MNVRGKLKALEEVPLLVFGWYTLCLGLAVLLGWAFSVGFVWLAVTLVYPQSFASGWSQIGVAMWIPASIGIYVGLMALIAWVRKRI